MIYGVIQSLVALTENMSLFSKQLQGFIMSLNINISRPILPCYEPLPLLFFFTRLMLSSLVLLGLRCKKKKQHTKIWNFFHLFAQTKISHISCFENVVRRERLYCVKSVQIPSISGQHTEKYGPEKIRIWKLFAQCCIIPN